MDNCQAILAQAMLSAEFCVGPSVMALLFWAKRNHLSIIGQYFNKRDGCCLPRTVEGKKPNRKCNQGRGTIFPKNPGPRSRAARKHYRNRSNKENLRQESL